MRHSMLKVELFSFYWHYYDSEWHLDLLLVETDFENCVERSLIGIGRKNKRWFLDLFWIRILPKVD